MLYDDDDISKPDEFGLNRDSRNQGQIPAKLNEIRSKLLKNCAYFTVYYEFCHKHEITV
jgi:hypothetical protein